MPYSFDTKHIKLSKEQDRRIKIPKSEHKYICTRYKNGESQRELAKAYGVSRRLITWILYPERLVINRKLRVKRGGWKQYYNKKKNTEAVRKTRQYKAKILKVKKRKI